MTLPQNPYIFGVSVIPASGEFIYDTVAYSGVQPGTTGFVPINTYFAPGGTKTDFEYSLDQLQQALPNCAFVALVVQWMGNSLDLSACQIYPSTTYWLGSEVGAFEPTFGGVDSGLAPSYWRVSGLTMADCNAGLIPISRNASGASAYGGTCSDQSVVRAIQAIKARGLKVCLYMQMNMDVVDQPWRGIVTFSPDVSSAATTAVNNFFGSASASQFTRDATNLTVNYSGSKYDFTYRRFILHYANLAVIAGGVNLFTIGSEMRGIEAIRGPAWTPAGTVTGGFNTWDYPAVAQLTTLINDCRAVFDAAGYTKNLAGRQNLIIYSADWSQWMGAQHAGITGIFPHLDPLFANSNTDLVSFDNYMPMSDWTTGGGGLDAVNWNAPAPTSWPVATPTALGLGLSTSPSVYDTGYLQFGLEHGEKGEYFYGDYASTTTLDPNGSGLYVTAPQGDRLTQARNPYYTGQELFAFKKFRWWWNNQHYAVYDNGDGHGAIPRGSPTAWVAQSKSIMWMEYGFGSIDRDTNEENLFYSPTSVAGGTPFWSNWVSAPNGALAPLRDDVIQFAGHQAWGTYWYSGTPNNETSGAGVAMIAVDMMFAWNWDARPFPTFPLRTDVWADGANWPYSLWLGGKATYGLPVGPSSPPSPGSYSTFPALATLGWSVHVRPKWLTGVAQHVSGRESRMTYRAGAVYDFELTYDVLRADAHAELQTIAGFYASQGGANALFWFTPTNPPAALAAPVLCRFAEDVADLENFMSLLWNWGSVKMQTVRF